MVAAWDVETLMRDHGLSQEEAAEVVRRAKSDPATWFIWLRKCVRKLLRVDLCVSIA